MLIGHLDGESRFLNPSRCLWGCCPRGAKVPPGRLAQQEPAAQDLQLVPKDEYLEFVGAVRTAPAEDPAKPANDEEREEGHRRMVDEPQVRPDVRFPRPTGLRRLVVRV
jgi:hypothetical protein